MNHKKQNKKFKIGEWILFYENDSSRKIIGTILSIEKDKYRIFSDIENSYFILEKSELYRPKWLIKCQYEYNKFYKLKYLLYKVVWQKAWLKSRES